MKLSRKKTHENRAKHRPKAKGQRWHAQRKAKARSGKTSRRKVCTKGRVTKALRKAHAKVAQILYGRG